MKLVAIDPGASTGCAWSFDGSLESAQHASWNLAEVGDPGRRYEYLCKLLDRYHVYDRLLWECAPGLRGQSLRWHLGYMAVAQLWCCQNQVDFLGVNCSTLKKFATGNGSAPKSAMRYAAAVYFKGEELRDEDKVSEHEIDALWLLAWGLDMARGAA